jgi:hypothetical protein
MGEFTKLQEFYILLWKELTFSHRQSDRAWVIRWLDKFSRVE